MELQGEIEAKQRELSSLHAQQIADLRAQLNSRESELDKQSTKLSKLKEDFKFNLHVLEERVRAHPLEGAVIRADDRVIQDKELERYDASFNDLREVLETRSDHCDSEWAGRCSVRRSGSYPRRE